MVDVIVVVVCALAAFRGWRKGLVGQVFELGGGFIGLILGIALGPRIASTFTDQAGTSAALVSLLVVFAFLSLGQAGGFILGHRFGQRLTRERSQKINRGLGSGFGIGVTLVAFWLVGSLLVGGPVRPVAKNLRKSEILQFLNDVMPRPPDVLAYLQQYINTSGFPQVFAGLPRALAPPVQLPRGPLARRAAQAAEASTVRVIVPACGGTQLGTGWIAGDRVIVTNAHVVAGGDDLSVTANQGSEESDGHVVLFDGRTDVAIIRLDESLSGPVLDLDETPYDRGEPGATLGYPGSKQGELEAKPAAVQARFEAVGRDIYGRGEVEREVYELRAAVREGDSGGPFVLPSGDVAGVVFAASTTDGEAGYALTGREVADEVAQGLRSTEPADTGGCTH